MQIGSRFVGPETLPYIIAEIGVNHEGSLEKAKELIDLAKKSGAHAAKFQSYKASTIASRHSPAYWDLKEEPTKSQFELFQKYDVFNSREYQILADYCRKVGIDFLSTPFDLDFVDSLDSLMSVFKVASADIKNVPLLRSIAHRTKPVILSTGASTIDEINTAVQILNEAGCKNIVLMHCVLAYPTPYSMANLNMIGGLEKAFPDCLVGYSDHTLPDSQMTVLLAAYIKGARVIEKHFTHDKTLKGNDHYHAMDSQDLMNFVRQLEFLKTVEGVTNKSPLPCENLARLHARRSLVLKHPVKKGERLVEALIIAKRPAHGISPLHIDEVIGMRVISDLPVDHILQWEDLAREKP